MQSLQAHRPQAILSAGKAPKASFKQAPSFSRQTQTPAKLTVDQSPRFSAGKGMQTVVSRRVFLQGAAVAAGVAGGLGILVLLPPGVRKFLGLGTDTANAQAGTLVPATEGDFAAAAAEDSKKLAQSEPRRGEAINLAPQWMQKQPDPAEAAWYTLFAQTLGNPDVQPRDNWYRISLPVDGKGGIFKDGKINSERFGVALYWFLRNTQNDEKYTGKNGSKGEPNGAFWNYYAASNAFNNGHTGVQGEIVTYNSLQGTVGNPPNAQTDLPLTALPSSNDGLHNGYRDLLIPAPNKVHDFLTLFKPGQ